jgi:hypothetical protein
LFYCGEYEAPKSLFSRKLPRLPFVLIGRDAFASANNYFHPVRQHSFQYCGIYKKQREAYNGGRRSLEPAVVP